MMQPDGMGADRYRERQNMKDAAHDGPSFNYDVVAVRDGEELFVTESAYTEEEAEEARQQCANARGTPDDVRYKVKERDD